MSFGFKKSEDLLAEDVSICGIIQNRFLLVNHGPEDNWGTCFDRKISANLTASGGMCTRKAMQREMDHDSELVCQDIPAAKVMRRIRRKTKSKIRSSHGADVLLLLKTLNQSLPMADHSSAPDPLGPR